MSTPSLSDAAASIEALLEEAVAEQEKPAAGKEAVQRDPERTKLLAQVLALAIRHHFKLHGRNQTTEFEMHAAIDLALDELEVEIDDNDLPMAEDVRGILR